MTEDVKDQQSNDELEALKARAQQMGLKVHHKIGLEKLRAQVNEALKQDLPTEQEPEKKTVAKKAIVGGTAPVQGKPGRSWKFHPKVEEKSLTAKQAASKLVRIKVNCMNPNKIDYEGEIFVVGNKNFGFKKYVPFNNDEGWHVPHMIYEHLKNRKCQIFVNARDDKGNQTRQGKLIHEFAVEVMDPLTPEELRNLSQRQAMASGT